MTKEEFSEFWETEYPEAYPINNELKWVYPDRWFRIHSQPKSKRYADTEEEYQIILERQNQLIDDIIGEGTDYISTFNLYTNDICNDSYKQLSDYIEYFLAESVNLKDVRPDDYNDDEDEAIMDIYMHNNIWKSGSKNQVLKLIADDEIEVIFTCPIKKCIIAPYDGGVDIIVESTEKRDLLKIKYRDWLSAREDGL